MEQTAKFSEGLNKLPPEEALYCLQNFPYHLAQAGEWKKMLHVLTDFDFMRTKLCRISIQSLIEDYTLLDVSSLEISKEDRNSLKNIQSALRQSAHILEQDQTALAGQLFGHLLAQPSSRIHQLLTQAKTYMTDFWLHPTTPSLTIPMGQWQLHQSLIRHTNEIESIAVTPDAHYVVSSDLKTLVVWDLKEGKILFEIERDEEDDNSDGIWAVTITPDGKRAFALDGATLKILELGENISQSSITTGIYAHRLSITPDGRYLFVIEPSTCGFWDIELQKEIFCVTGIEGSIMAAYISDGEYRVITAENDNLVIWDALSQKELFSLEGHMDLITDIAITSDGCFAISASVDCTIRVWNLETRAEIHTLEGHALTPASLSVAADGRTVASASGDCTVKVWDIQEGRLIQTLQRHDTPVKSVIITPDGQRILSGSIDGIIYLWKRDEIDGSFASSERDPYSHTAAVSALTITPDDDYILSASADETMIAWLLSVKGPVAFLKYQYPSMKGPQIPPDLFRIFSHYHVFSGDVPPSGINSIAITTDMRCVVIAAADGILRLLKFTHKFDVIGIASRRNRYELIRLEGHPEIINSVAITPDNRYAVTGSNDCTLKIWDLKKEVEVSTIQAHEEPSIAVKITLDGRYILSATRTEVKTWQLKNRKYINAFSKDDREVVSLAVTSKSYYVFTQDVNFNLEVWDLSSQILLYSLSHPDRINAVSITMDECYLVSASNEGAIRLWDLTKQRLMATFNVSSPIRTCAIQSAQKMIVVGDNLGRVHFFQLEQGRK